VQTLLDWIYPPTCIACKALLPLNEPERFICVSCRDIFEPILHPNCLKCGAPTDAPVVHCASCRGRKFYFSHNISTFTYDELMRELINDMKFNRKKRVAQGLGILWANSTDRNLSSVDFFIPVPMHRKKQNERGFNQAETLTIPLAKAFQIPMLPILARTVDTVPQSEVHPSRRAENVKDIFLVTDPSAVKNKNIILTDDIFTTGASLNECAKALKKAGAGDISCMTLAISVKNNDNP